LFNLLRRPERPRRIDVNAERRFDACWIDTPIRASGVSRHWRRANYMARRLIGYREAAAFVGVSVRKVSALVSGVFVSARRTVHAGLLPREVADVWFTMANGMYGAPGISSNNEGVAMFFLHPGSMHKQRRCQGGGRNQDPAIATSACIGQLSAESCEYLSSNIAHAPAKSGAP
jgi:hypothetical protein